MSQTPPRGSWQEAVRWLRSQPDQADLVREAYYDDPLESAAQRYWRSEEWQSVRDLLPASRGLALDVGAGRGIASYALAREGYRVVALEPDPGDLVGAGAVRSLQAATGLPIEVREDFSERLPFADGMFDLVFARAVLHHTRDLTAACLEFARVLRPGGLLLAIREHVISRPEDLPAFHDLHPLHHLYGGEHAFLLTEYQQALATARFGPTVTLGPLASALNYAPHSLASLQGLIAARLCRPLPVVAPLARGLLRIAPVWQLLRPLLQQMDHRPGRLYSFVAHRN